MSGRTQRSGILGAVCFVLLVVALVLSLCVGAKRISYSELIKALFAFDPGNKNHVILRTLRLPRTLTAAAVGSGLGLALAMILFPAASLHVTVLFSFAGAGAAAGVIFLIAAVSRVGSTPVGLALTGTAITALFHAVSQALATFFNIS